MNMIEPRTMCPRPRLPAKISALTATLLAAICVMVFCANPVSAQRLRRQMRIQKKINNQKKIDRKLDRQSGNQNKLSPSGGGKEEPGGSNQLEATPPKAVAQQGMHSLDGIRQRGIHSFFTHEEASLLIPGFVASPVALLMIFRQLDLTPDQKVKIRGIRRQTGNRLQVTRRELVLLEAQLEEAIYGNNDPASLDSYDPARVNELTVLVAEKRSEAMKTQTEIESQLRQILTPDQFYVFRELVREMVLPGGRRINPANRQQQQRRIGVQPNMQNRPDPQIPPENN